MEQENAKGQFNSNFGFLMACIGSAVGLGNLWAFPYKLGTGGGFAFLFLYLLFAVFIGYPLLLTEVALGRKSGKAAVEAYTSVRPGFAFNGVLQSIVPWLLMAFYCTFGGFVMRYLVGSLGAFGGNWLDKNEPGVSFAYMLTPDNALKMVGWMAVFLVLTMLIVFGGVSGGIEKFCKFAMPALFVMIIIIAIRSCTLTGAGEGISFLFTPHLDALKENFFGILTMAGGQLFFSLSLSSGCMIAYGSYLGKDQNLEFDSLVITIGGSCVAIFCSLMIMPAVFAFGLEPGAGPGLLFVTMTTVFQSMGLIGHIFQLLFWILVFFAALTSSVGMMEAGIASIMDARIKAGKKINRISITLAMSLLVLALNFLTTFDCLGENPAMNWAHILGQPTVLDVWDCVAEGLLMPITGLIMTIMLGWIVPNYLDDEIEIGSKFKSRNFYHLCIKWISPILMIVIVIGQVTGMFSGLIESI